MTLIAESALADGKPDPRRLYGYHQTAEALLNPSAALAPGAREAYMRDGFLAVSDVLTPEEIETAKRELHDLMRRPLGKDILQPEAEVRDRWETMTTEERVDSIRKLFRFIPHSESMAQLARAHPKIQAILSHLVGEPCNLIQDMAMLKPPRIGIEKPWHQDGAYFAWGPPERIIGVWIALDPATAENGCMHVLPGTHREGAVPHYHLRDCQIPDERVQVERDVIVPLEPGGALFFSALLHHGTPPNDSPHRRWALQFHYAAASCVRVNVRQHADQFFEGDVYAGCMSPGPGRPLTTLPDA